MRKSDPFILLIPLLIFCMLIFFLVTYLGTTSHTLREGEPVTVAQGKTVLLRGPWAFYWNDFLLDPGDREADERVELPYQWYNFLPDRGYPLFGRATYRMTLKTQGMRGENALYIPPIDSACRIYVNGKLVGERGRPSASADEEKPQNSPFVVTFRQDTDELEIVLHVSNHHMFAGGISQQVIEYGRVEDVHSRFISLILRDAFLFIVLLSIGIRSLSRFLLEGKKRHNVIFAFISLLYAFRVLLTGRMLVYPMFPFYSVSALSASILITSFLSLPLFLAYIRYSYPREFPPYVTPGAFLLSAGLSLAVFFVPLQVQPLLLAGYGVAVALGGLLCIVILILAVKRRRPNAPYVLAAALIILGCGINDILHTSGLVSTMLLMNLGIVVFGFMQVLILSTYDRKLASELSGVHGKLWVMESLQDIFLSTAAGDLLKPLKGITEVSESLLRGSLGPITSDQLGSLSLINASSLQLANMVGDVIDFRKIQQGGLNVQKRMVNLFFLIERVKAAASLFFHEKELLFKNNIHRDEEMAYADENLLERVFFNLARGFAEFAESGSLTVRSAVADTDLDIQCIWEGTGIPRPLVSTAFTVFDQTDETGDRKATGVSLALSISKRLVESQQGFLRLCPEDEDPLVITITLPRQTATKDRTATEEEAAHLDALINLEPVLDDVVLTRNIDIMVVSNNLMDLQVMKSQLASMNYNVIPVTGGPEALEKIKEKCPNLVLLDVYLHNMDGYEVCGRIRESYSSSELPVILLTEKEKVSDLMRGLTSGANDFLARPYHMEEFLTRVNTHIQLARINQMYSRFVPTEFLNTLGQENIIDLKLGDQVQREMTVLFVDIRAFTNLSENMSPQENFMFINSYLSRFSPMITKHHGFVDKFIGDAIMALYPGKPEDAIDTALEMVEHVKVYNSHRANCGYPPINIGVGIHTGNLILGIIGDSQRMQGTVISDAVNLASRIQDVTKLYHTSIVISQETFVKLENPMAYDFRFLGKVKVKGKAKSVSLFEIYSGEDETIKKLKTDTKNDFETAIILFSKRQFEEAEVILGDIVEKNPSDYASQLFLDRARKFLTAGKRAFLSSI